MELTKYENGKFTLLSKELEISKPTNYLLPGLIYWIVGNSSAT